MLARPRISKSLTIALAAGALLQLAGLAPAAQRPTAKPVGWGPLTSRQAAERVERSSWEPRPANRTANRTVPGPERLRRWRQRSEMPYARHVDGRFRGTTDEIIQWSARKWGFRPNLLRAVATVESWWRQSAVGDNGDSFGLFQVRRPYHCWGACRIARDSTAFNADYYGGILRAYFDGRMKWLNTVERGREYRPGDLWGSVGAWYAGRWWTEPAKAYIEVVRQRLLERTWREPGF
jgi:soluble lytic murein transglycosylase-like protein